MDHHYLDLFIRPYRDPGHQRDVELEFGLVGVHLGVWDSVVLGVPEAQVHWTYHYLRAIRQGLSKVLGKEYNFFMQSTHLIHRLVYEMTDLRAVT